MAWVEVHCAVESVNLHRHDWDSGDDDEPMPMTTVTLHLEGFPSEQTIDLVFDSVATLQALAAVLSKIAADAFEHGRDWRMGDGVDVWARRYGERG